MPINLKAANDDDGRRLDRILRKALKDLPLSAIHRLLRKGLVLVEGKKAGGGLPVKAGETITVNVDSANYANPAGGEKSAVKSARKIKPFEITGGNAPEIIYEGAGLLVVNKPAGIAVHGGNSLESFVLSYLTPKLSPSLSFTPGPLHRLDKPSSGLIVFSSSLEGARVFSAAMREQKIRKFYLALVEGSIKKEETWRDDLFRDRVQKKTFSKASKDARRTESGAGLKTGLTKIKPLAFSSGASLVLAEIITGRTHQIRAQAAVHGHPLLGDKKYGGRSFPFGGTPPETGFLLHALRVELPENIPLPFPEKPPPRFFEAPPPEYFQSVITGLFGKLPIQTIPFTIPAARF